MLGGYMGKYLRVNLTTKKIKEEPLPKQSVLRKYIGGLGLGMRMLYDEVPPGVGPYDPGNKLFLFTGPLTGTAVPCATNVTMVTVNQETEGLTCAASHTHGFWGVRLKFAGYDGVIIEGVSRKPVYLFIEDGKAEIRDASKFWGKDTHETEDLIKEEIGKPDVSVLCIGPGGENLVTGGAWENDKHHTLAKGGTGSIGGFKKLKAIVVRGTGKVPLADPEKLKSAAKEWREHMFDNETGAPAVCKDAGILRNYGYPMVSMLSAKNLTEPNLESYAVGLKESAARMDAKPHRCWGCPIGCCYEVKISGGPADGYVATLCGGGENHEGAAAIVGIYDTGTAWMMTDKYDRLGLDSSTHGCTFGMVFECYEKGIITKEDTGGLELKWGDHEALLKLLDMMVKREGFGKLLADGPRRAAERIGKGAAKLVAHMKGTGFNLHDWRNAWSTYLGQVIAGSGPVWHGPGFDANATEPDLGHPSFRQDVLSTEGKAADVRASQLKKIWDSDCLGLCWFGTWGVTNVTAYATKALEGATGWKNFSREEAFAVGERVVNLERLFNMKRGLTIADDLDVGPRFLEAPVKGAAKGVSIAPYLRMMVEEYYELMGWERNTGKPLPATLRRLGMSEYLKDLKKL
ncbi:MAG TPA: aldehyde ferredoxin oxidoreductase C-terminal domain-containing protein [Thermodesulfobacteriota bacterium]|nr:aldehyde ferredoxin oxidoreductase C-terminal domain-containing protein [Thermodesulfobacteriota bacterium]